MSISVNKSKIEVLEYDDDSWEFYTFVCTFLEFGNVDWHLLDLLLCFLVICCSTTAPVLPIILINIIIYRKLSSEVETNHFSNILVDNEYYSAVWYYLQFPTEVTFRPLPDIPFRVHCTVTLVLVPVHRNTTKPASTTSKLRKLLLLFRHTYTHTHTGPDLMGDLRGPGPRPPTNRRPPTKLFIG